MLGVGGWAFSVSGFTALTQDHSAVTRKKVSRLLMPPPLTETIGRSRGGGTELHKRDHHHPSYPPRVEKGTPDLTSDTAGKGSWKEAAGEKGGGGTEHHHAQHGIK